MKTKGCLYFIYSVSDFYGTMSDDELDSDITKIQMTFPKLWP